MTLKDLIHSEYRERPHYLVVGNPIGHSLSPLMHQIALDHYGIDADYKPLELKPDEIGRFSAWINRDSFLGCNITIPYKEEMMTLVDSLSAAASEIGVINTIIKKSGMVMGDNTDLHGFIDPIADLSHLIEGGRAVVFGTGGASKAVIAGLEQLGVEEIVLVSRNPRGKQLPERRVHTELVDYHQWQAFADETAIFVNTTPVGMHPNVDSLFIDEVDSELFGDSICYDLIYNPQMTRFLKLAEKEGAVVINGLDMFIAQGSRSFELWTGKSFPEKKIRKALINHFEK